MAESEGAGTREIAGYACWGPIPGTTASVDLYWIVVHPMNRFWLRETQLGAGGETFFGLGAADPADRDWTAIRDRWEYGHLARAILAVIAFICLAVFTAL